MRHPSEADRHLRMRPCRNTEPIDSLNVIRGQRLSPHCLRVGPPLLRGKVCDKYQANVAAHVFIAVISVRHFTATSRNKLADTLSSPFESVSSLVSQAPFLQLEE